MPFHPLRKTESGSFITHPKPFSPLGTFRTATVERVFDFAFGISFGHKGEHRDHRTGGEQHRKNGQIFANAFQGKLAEFAVYNAVHRLAPHLEQKITEPDLSLHRRGIWDSGDLSVGDAKISIKSTKHFGQLLLLETGDWNSEGRYIPDIHTTGGDFHGLVLTRIKSDIEKILMELRFLYASEISENRISSLKSAVLARSWEFDVPGCITPELFAEIRRRGHIIVQHEQLNGHTAMDADNFYVQAGDLIELDQFLKTLS